MGMYNAEKRRIVSVEADIRGQWSRGRQRKRWIDVVKYNMEDLRVDLMDVESGDGEPMWLNPHPRDLNFQSPNQHHQRMIKNHTKNKHYIAKLYG